MINKEELNKELLEGFEAVFGKVPEDRKPEDLTASEIAELWKMDKGQIYKAVKKGLLETVKVFDHDLNKTILVYRVKKN